ncbi:MAG: LysR family transcriptional regulator [Lachnospiraceae bacterium]|nr:LysR family transcriptional regulator [Lachnospiraceae bacterium]
MFSNAEYVYEVYKERSFSRAAQNLYISQPALSVTIKRIEQRVGAPLFDRSTNPIGLTECGQKYIEVVKQMMDLQSGFVNYLNDLEDLNAGVVNVGGSNLFTSCLLPPIISEYKNRYPAVEINVVEANTPLLDHLLMEGRLDLILDNYMFDKNTHDSHLYRREELLLAVPARFPVNRSLKEYQISREDIISGRFRGGETAAAPFESFRGLPFILLKAGNDTRDRAFTTFAEHKMQPSVILELDQQMTSYNVSCQGLGISFVSDTLVRSVPADRHVCFYKLDSSCAQRDLRFFRKKAKYVTRAVREFLNIADQLAQQ